MGFPEAWALTLAIEAPILLLLIGRQSPIMRTAAIGALASTITLPFVWSVFPALIPAYYPALAAGELFALLAEALIYFRAFPWISPARALAYSFLCNCASFILGLLLL